jgi:signal transduction histidine kinase
MEWKGNKRVRKYIGVCLLFWMLFSLFMFLVARYEITKDWKRMITLMTEHPELEGEIIAAWEKGPDHPLFGDGVQERDALTARELRRALRLIEEKYGYDLNYTRSAGVLWGFWGAGVCVGTFLIVAAGVLEWQKSQTVRDHLREMYECLEAFRAGEFGGIPDYEADAERYSEEWMKVWESLRELGVYFEGLRAQLREEEKNTKTLITDISHQLKTPLASLRMCRELAAADQLTEEERREFQEQEGREIEKLTALLQELVNLSRLETNMIQLKPAGGSLKKTIAGAVSQVYVKARNKEIEIQADIDGDLVIRHDAKWTEEAIVNILDNAVKYSKEHTVVTVRAKPLIRNVLIEIEDEGIGIRKTELPKIYQRFYRGNDAAKMAKDGAGVGLYLARMILERQGGTISAKPKTGGGMIFRVTLPC